MEHGPDARQPAPVFDFAPGPDERFALLLHDPALGEELLHQPSDRARRGHVQDDQHRDQRGPAAQRLARAQPEEHAGHHEQADDAGPRAAGEVAEQQQRGRHPPAALPPADREVDRERNEHRHHRTELDRAARRRERAQVTAARFEGPRGFGVVGEDRQQPVKVVEDVVAVAPLDDRVEPDERTAGDEQGDDPLHDLARVHDADDEVEEQDEAEEQPHGLDDVAGDGPDVPRVRDVRGQRDPDDEQQRPLEARGSSPHAGVDQQRDDPPDQQQPDQQAIGLELEGQRFRERVAAVVRDQQDDEHDQADQRRPAPCEPRDEHRQRNREQRDREDPGAGAAGEDVGCEQRHEPAERGEGRRHAESAGHR